MNGQGCKHLQLGRVYVVRHACILTVLGSLLQEFADPLDDRLDEHFRVHECGNGGGLHQLQLKGMYSQLICTYASSGYTRFVVLVQVNEVLRTGR